MLHDSHWARALARAVAADHPGKTKTGRALLGWARARAAALGFENNIIARAALLGPITPAPDAREDESLLQANRLADALDLAAEERALLLLVTAMERAQLTRSLAKLIDAEVLDIEALVGALHGVGEADSDGDEPSRFDRVAALRLALRTLERRGRALLLFDEMEDLLGSAQVEPDGRIRNRQGSKLFVNRLLEDNVVPVIWTSNCIADIDPAILRRFSLSIRMDFPGIAHSPAMLDRVSREEQVAVDPALAALAAHAPEAASLFRIATRAAALAGDAESANRFAGSILGAMRGETVEPRTSRAFDATLLAADTDLRALFASLASQDGPADFSLLLTGEPGTGKTEAVQALARQLGRPLHIKRASDLMSKWVGETEKAIARAFAEARRQGAMLFFDEVDSLLADRHTASQSWEISQVNELLTWMEDHPLPFAAATNHAAKLDPASARRFVFKVEMRALDVARARRAFAHFFGSEAPAALDALVGLTLGDFAVVARQLRFTGVIDDRALVDRRRERAARPALPQPMGFGSHVPFGREETPVA